MKLFLILTLVVISLLLIGAIAMYAKHVARPIRDKRKAAKKSIVDYQSIDRMLNDLLY